MFFYGRKGLFLFYFKPINRQTIINIKMVMFEIHVSVNLHNPVEEIEWKLFCKQQKFHVIKVWNIKGTHATQNMMAMWISVENNEENNDWLSVGLKELKRTGNIIRETGFEVIREKIEAMMMDHRFDKHCLEKPQRGVYWEIHMKVENQTLEQWRMLKDMLKTEQNVGLSVSAYSEFLSPIITMRFYQGSRDQVFQMKDQLVGRLTTAGWKFAPKTQYELSLYDSNPELDEGWIDE